MNFSHYNDRIDRVDRVNRLHRIHRAVVYPDLVPTNPPVRDWRHFERSDPFEDLNDVEFRDNYRFTKQSVHRLVSELLPYLVDDKRRHCLTPMQQVLMTLDYLGGDEFMRTTARHVRCTRMTVHNCVDRVFAALEHLKPKYVRLPTAAEEEASAAEIKRLYNLDNIAYGIDCVHMEFKHRPRKVLGGLHADLFYNRKERFSLNVQVIGDAFQLIRDIDVRYPGSVHDSRIWANSRARIHMSGRQYFIAADSGYALSDTVLKRFDVPDPEHPEQALFNYRLSQARVKMTECIFGMWEARFPILTNMRFSHLDAMRAVVATAVFMNFGTMERLNLEFPTIERLPNALVVDERPPEQALQAGVNARDDYVSLMVGPQTRREWRVWNGHTDQ